MFKKSHVLSLCLTAALSGCILFAGCGTETTSVQDHSTAEAVPSGSAETEAGTSSAAMQTANPWTETASLEDAESGSGISFTPPIDEALAACYDNLSLETYRYMTGTIEADYTNGSDTLSIRKSSDTEGQTLSGDYTEYSSTWDYSMKGLGVTCRGDGTRINEATFSVDNDHYAISFDIGEEEKGITEDALTSLLMGM